MIVRDATAEYASQISAGSIAQQAVASEGEFTI